MTYTNLTKYQSICLILIVIVNHLIIDLPDTIIDSCGSGAIVNSIYVVFLAFILTILGIKLFKNFTDYDILDISEFLGGKIFKRIFAVICIVSLIFSTSILLRNFAEGLELTYFKNIPISIILLFFLIPPAISSRFGFNTVFKINCFIVPIMLVSFLVLIIMTASSFQVQHAFPLLGYGFKQTFIHGATNIFAFPGLEFMFFFIPFLKNKNDYKQISLISLAITGFLLVAFITSLILSFAYLRFLNELSPIYLLVRASNYGEFLQRPESIYIFIWILSFLAYINSIVILLLYISQKTLYTTQTKNLSFLFCNAIFFVALIPSSIWQLKFIETYIYKYSNLVIFLVFGFVVLILANIKYKKKGASIKNV